MALFLWTLASRQLHRAWVLSAKSGYEEEAREVMPRKSSPWSRLRKAWKEYRTAKKQNQELRMIEAARKVRAIQAELGVLSSPFPEISEADLNA